MLLAHNPSRRLGNPNGSNLVFREDPKPAGSWAGMRRLYVGGEAAFTLSYWCGTCQFVFKRAGQGSGALRLPLLTERLNRGLSKIDVSVLATVSNSLPVGDYLPLLLSVQPRLINPGMDGDYFAHEQVDTWGADYDGGSRLTPKRLTTGPLRHPSTRTLTSTNSSSPLSLPHGMTPTALPSSSPRWRSPIRRPPWRYPCWTSASLPIGSAPTTTNTGR